MVKCVYGVLWCPSQKLLGAMFVRGNVHVDCCWCWEYVCCTAVHAESQSHCRHCVESQLLFTTRPQYPYTKRQYRVCRAGCSVIVCPANRITLKTTHHDACAYLRYFYGTAPGTGYCPVFGVGNPGRTGMLSTSGSPYPTYSGVLRIFGSRELHVFWNTPYLGGVGTSGAPQYPLEHSRYSGILGHSDKSRLGYCEIFSVFDSQYFSYSGVLSTQNTLNIRSTGT